METKSFKIGQEVSVKVEANFVLSMKVSYVSEKTVQAMYEGRRYNFNRQTGFLRGKELAVLEEITKVEGISLKEAKRISEKESKIVLNAEEAA